MFFFFSNGDFGICRENWYYYNGLSDEGAPIELKAFKDRALVAYSGGISADIRDYKIVTPFISKYFAHFHKNEKSNEIIDIGNQSNGTIVTKLDDYFNKWIENEPDKNVVSNIFCLTFLLTMALRSSLQKRENDFESLLDHQYIDYSTKKNRDESRDGLSSPLIQYTENVIVTTLEQKSLQIALPFGSIPSLSKPDLSFIEKKQYEPLILETKITNKEYKWVHPIPLGYESYRNQRKSSRTFYEKLTLPSLQSQLLAKLFYKKQSSDDKLDAFSILESLEFINDSVGIQTIMNDLSSILSKDTDKFSYKDCLNKAHYDFYKILKEKVSKYDHDTLSSPHAKSNGDNSSNAENQLYLHKFINSFTVKIFPNIPKSIQDLIYFNDFKWLGFSEEEQNQLLFIIPKNPISNICDIIEESHEISRGDANQDKFVLMDTPINHYVLTFNYNLTRREIFGFKLVIANPKDNNVQDQVSPSKKYTAIKVTTVPITEIIFNKLLSNALILLTSREF